jgi:hypothetical protein
MLILVFAGIYYWLPARSFYHSTAQYEYDAFNGDASKVLVTLGDGIRANLRKHYKSSDPSIRGWVVDAEALQASSLSVREFPDSFSFQLSEHVSRIDTQTGLPIETRSTSTVTVPMSEWTITGGQISLYPKPVVAPGPLMADVPSEPSLSDLLPFDGNGGVPVSPVLSMQLSLYNEIVDIGNGYRGFPSKVSGEFWRMLYFSAGIATSSALGDIVPMTPASRLLVGVEAVLSLCVVALFLNSLAVYIGRRVSSGAPVPIEHLRTGYRGIRLSLRRPRQEVTTKEALAGIGAVRRASTRRTEVIRDDEV